MHCGNCGKCSNRDDIDIYERTKDTLTYTTTRCAYAYLVLGRWAAAACMRRSVGFTDSCNECWLDNIECDMRECLWICLKHTLAGSANNLEGEELNACLACDEEQCGPVFIQCAGANRRRSGIISDIGRPNEQVCTDVDPWPAGGRDRAAGRQRGGAGGLEAPRSPGVSAITGGGSDGGKGGGGGTCGGGGSHGSGL
ncbi:unnamed protein product [Phaeothamnion confervicola]